ncbi:Calx-beta domain-containing protein [Thalassotalea sediminis]|uniref:Calx-beta domain-containing protein n=1 Tax=Thalassotalea sediminis TaxID=1759089 RepID=UPI00257446F0|nr:Calx-beta domain-containing protein [Thalassotalea sediminis]
MRNILGALSLLIAPQLLAADNLFTWRDVSADKQANAGISTKYQQGEKFSIDSTALSSYSIGDNFTINLKNGASYQAIVTNIKNKKHTKHIIAHIKTDQQQLPVVITQGKSQFFMRIVSPEQTWVAQGKTHSGWLINENVKQVAPLNNDVKIPKHQVTKNQDAQLNRLTNRSEITANNADFVSKPNKSASNESDIANVDVLFVYAIPQDFIDSEYNGDVLTRIQHLIEVTNQIYVDSNVNLTVSAADIISVDYPSDLDSDAALDDITFNDHAAFSDIKNLRYEKGADMVALLRPYVDGDSACGLAWGNASITTSINYMYSHTSIDCGDYVLAHELGHNMGLAHSRAQGDTGYTFPFALGHRVADPENGFSSVMAYAVNNASKVYKFSNPEILCTELPCGVDRNDPINGADARFALNQVNSDLANLYTQDPNLILSSDALSNISDDNLKSCLSNLVNNNNIKYAGQVTNVYCAYSNIDSLTGIENFPNIVSLVVNNNNISDITSLSHLTKLSIVYLDSNAISNISPLSSLTSLTQVYLDHNNITDISALTASDNLQMLWMSDNNIEDIAALSNKQSLRFIYASDNNIKSLEPLKNADALAQLYVSANEISDVSPLSNLPVLKTLNLGSNQINDISSLTNLPKLETLSLYYNQLSNVDALFALKSLVDLELDGNQITILPNSGQLPKLAKLAIDDNDIQDISLLNAFTSLVTLEIRGNNITDISPIQSLSGLTSLYADRNPITVLPELSNLTNIKTFSLYNTAINSLEFVKQLPALTSLNIGNTNVIDITPLKNAYFLNNFDLSNTDISDISAIFELHNTWQVVNFSGVNEIKCWQQDYVKNYLTVITFTASANCSSTEDTQDFDGDGVSNRNEIDSGSYPIYHNNEPGNVHFQFSSAVLNEDASPTRINVIRSQGGKGFLSVDIVTNSGTAIAGSDYVGITQTLDFAENEFFKTLNLRAVDDDSYDDGKSFSITLKNVLNGTVGSPDTIDVTMKDNDQANIAWLQSNIEVLENAGFLTLTLQRPEKAENAASVKVGYTDYSAINGEHYQFTEQTISFADGEYSKDINIELVNDDVYSGDKTFYLTLTDAVGAVVTSEDKLLTITIVDDEQPAKGSVSLSSSTASVNENTSEVSLILIRENGSYGELNVAYQTLDGTALSGSDYTSKNGTVIFADGEIEKSITISIIDDNVDESNENFSVTISSDNEGVIGTTNTTTITILDNDSTATPPSSSGGGSGGGTLWYLLTLLTMSMLLKRKTIK